MRFTSPAEIEHGFAVITINDIRTKLYSFSLLFSAGFEVLSKPDKPSTIISTAIWAVIAMYISQGFLSPSSLGLVRLDTVPTGVKQTQ